jgi:hypothetical protein
VADASRRVLEHSVTYALIEINNPAATSDSGTGGFLPLRRAALIAPDQMDNGRLQSDRIVPLLDSADPVLKDTAW